MSSAPTFVQRRLAGAVAALDGVLHGVSLSRRATVLGEVLEAVVAESCRLDLAFLRSFSRDTKSVLSTGEARRYAIPVGAALRDAPAFHPAVAVAALGEIGAKPGRRVAGAYYTDPRLAALAAAGTEPGETLLDPACGSGSLLVASALAACGTGAGALRRYVATCVHGWDVSPNAIRYARASLAALAPDRAAVRALNARLRCIDSLRDDPGDDAPAHFARIIVNPPWEKLKRNRHEFAADRGVGTHYGDDVVLDARTNAGLRRHATALKCYADVLRARYETVRGEVDLYACFVERALELGAEDGVVTLIVPGGLIRSHGAALLRERLFAGRAVELDLLDNRGQFFPIDSRTKFLVVRARRAPRPTLHVRTASAQNDATVVERSRAVAIGFPALRATRPDLSVPEVRSAAEWRLFRRLAVGAPRVLQADTPFAGTIRRELDMTMDRPSFRRGAVAGAVPVIEGRHVAAFRHDAKGYVSGTGRRAVWHVRPERVPCMIEPQFWVERRVLRDDVREAIDRTRIGFCDVVGQTNERTVQAALIPAGVTCGNKVPTIELAHDGDDMLFLLLGIMNSIVFDWLARRVVTTSLNQFILASLPLPALDAHTVLGRRITHLARDVSVCGHQGGQRAAGELLDGARIELEVSVAAAYGVTPRELEQVFSDFPLLDRRQPPLPGETRSTVTADTVISEYAQRQGTREPAIHVHAERAAHARELGARPLVTTESAKAMEGMQHAVARC